ncbi:RNA polymerase II subunit A C-terminal domain phosphatase [Pimephales promelas]|uniref:RNA polymerase II subunit A C-terminal domain phosphatase n=1 Tax=Pimephales promelas TaxID=90988 RepID=UPI001955E84C|nr:RNA polymerase II subunit A C-terminal domain phosphatase [Pimephales promelas]KAG1947436.1 RNA polymerase II subunit A C-terminal domain phosphatase [Pimephales promelas]
MEESVDSGGAAPEGPTVQVTEIRYPAGARPLRLLEWKVKPGARVNVDSVIAVCAPITAESESRAPERKLKSDRAGVVRELCCQLGQVIAPGGVIAKVEECSHPVVMKGLCAECGQDLTQLQSKNGKQQVPISTATVSMVHSVPELMVSSEQAEQLGREDQQRLHRNRKLVLMVDLDQTLIHTTEQHCQRMSNKGIFHFQLGRGEPMLHTRLRPHCKDFLEKIAKLYELHVFTFGSRLYAHTIAGFLDPEKKLFSHRIMSRDECIDPYSKTGNLRNLFPCGDSMVCIIDDREDVWKFAPNLITVKKYIYFQGTGDINAPPGSREAQMAKKGSQAGRPSENLESSGQEEQRNGLRKSSKDRKTGHEELSSVTTTTQGASANERTHSTGESESRDDKCNVKTEGEGSSGVTSTSGETDFPNTAANDLDFDLSSDSESEGKMGLSDSDGEGQPVDAGKTKQTKTEECKIKEDDGDKPRTEGDDIPETDPEGLGDLGNGCSDKKEVETESQNSEQSAVTMGEESLDHSMEDEDDEEEEDIDQDDHLIYLEEVLVRIHTEYYSRYEAFLRKESSETPDIRKIVPELKGRTLEGATIIFSGLYPTNYPMERTREWYHAKALGAKIGKTLVLNDKDPNRTTHLIAARAGTEKVRQAQDCKHLHVVNPDWLWGCLERWERIEEQLFPLKEDYNKSHRSSSPAAFLDLQGSVPRPLFQAPPVQHKSLAPPEMRTYDPVTGKLIRRGPQASRPPSYLRSHGSSMSTKGDMSTLRSGQGSQERDAAAGSSADDEQPGPSRRKRQPSMSESMPLYTLCKEDLDSMDKEVDDMLGEESDNESDGKGKERMEAEEDEEERLPTSKQKAPSSDHGSPLATVVEENAQTSTREDASVTGNMFRGCKRKLEEARDDNDDDEDCGGSSKDSNEEGSSSEADEMAAALDAELNDFM